MRVGAAIVLLDHALVKLRIGGPIESVAFAVLGAGAGILLLAGLWTPVTGALVVVIALWNASARSGDLWLYVMLATLGAGLALLGPGAWSLDARLFGWKRIDFRDRQN